MNVFIFTTLIVLGFFAIGYKPIDYSTIETEKTRIRDTNALFFILGVILFVYITGQRFAFGDTTAYMGYFEKANDSIIEALSKFSIGEEWLFQFYIVLVKNLVSTDARVFIEITSFITIFPIMYFYYNYSGDLKFAFYLFVVSGCWEHSLNGLRQYLASSILLMAFAFLQKRRWYIYLPIVFMVAQIHTSAYIFLVLYFIVNKPAWGKTTKLILIFGLLVALSSPLTSGFVKELLSESTEYGVTYGGSEWDYGINIFRVLVMSVPVIISYINRKNMVNKYKYYNIVFNMSLFCLVFTLVGVISAVYARFNLYFEAFNVLLLVWNINDMSKSYEYKWIKPATCIMYGLYFLYQMVITYGYSWHERSLFFVNNWGESSWL